MKALEINDLSCTFGQTAVLSGLNLSIASGEIVCLLGQSGCGKTTLLKSVSGLLQPSTGTIAFQGNNVSSPLQVTPPEQRKMGMIFQDYALFPHLNVFHNIAFGLQKQSSNTKRKRVDELLELVNLQGLHKRYPHELSGGQQQRVAIARALANKPGLLLLDEPFSNIDSQIRQRLVLEIRDILKDQKVAALFVTHSKEEGFAFADRLAIMDKGKILQTGTASDIYNRPANRFVADFMGVGNYLPVESIDSQVVKTALGNIKLTTTVVKDNTNNKSLSVFIRPANIVIKNTHSHCESIIKRQRFMGQSIRSEVDFQGGTVIVEHANAVDKEQPVSLSIQPHPVILFDQSGVAIH